MKDKKEKMSMKYFLIVVIFFLLSWSSVYAQSDYDFKVAEAWDFFKENQWKEAGIKYLEAFEIEKSYYSVNDKYNAGKALAEAGMLDEAFDQFFYLANHRKYFNYHFILESDDLLALKKDPRWGELVELVKKNKEYNEVGMDADAVYILDKIRIEYDLQNAERIKLGKEKGYQSQEMVALRAAHQPLKEAHLKQILELLDEKGFLGPEEIGVKNRNTVFNILRRARIETHDEYLPIFEEAFSKDKLTPNQYASIIDRISLFHENRQVYGTIFDYDKESEIYYLLPIKNPENVNLKRAEIGAMSIEERCESSNMKWDLEEHKKMTIEYDGSHSK
ncbi:DUF6624 domain-containing protein [Portibacter lacus]|uniref:Uncharacterized protein n=1 Tax=Portibacter lacus TaxID=1099794 RepID=A0AA37SMK4_9BACT|nr:DUF6624 domain-containing protein [Portibacter lacus]GLR17483.1 hypothetical protein GCM10007940_20980 [Portibacter lacus]